MLINGNFTDFWSLYAKIFLSTKMECDPAVSALDTRTAFVPPVFCCAQVTKQPLVGDHRRNDRTRDGTCMEEKVVHETLILAQLQ